MFIKSITQIESIQNRSKMKKNKIILSFIFLVFVVTTQAQTKVEENKLSLENGTIDNQFEYVIQRSNNYQEFKVVNKNWLYTLKSHTIDSLKLAQKNLIDTKVIVKNQKEEITKLKASLATTEGNLNKTNLEKDSISLLGMPMSKSGYNILMWSIIAALLACLMFFIYKFKNSNSITKDAKNALNEMEEAFNEHRKVALEREQKVRRQLQDEINKHKSNS